MTTDPDHEPHARRLADRAHPRRNSQLYGHRPFEDEPDPAAAAGSER